MAFEWEKGKRAGEIREKPKNIAFPLEERSRGCSLQGKQGWENQAKTAVIRYDLIGNWDFTG